MSVSEGDVLYATRNECGLQISATDPDFERQLEVYRNLKNRYRNASRELAK